MYRRSTGLPRSKPNVELSGVVRFRWPKFSFLLAQCLCSKRGSKRVAPASDSLENVIGASHGTPTDCQAISRET